MESFPKFINSFRLPDSFVIINQFVVNIFSIILSYLCITKNQPVPPNFNVEASAIMKLVKLSIYTSLL